MRGEFPVDMFREAMIFLTGYIHRINMDCGIGKITQMMKELVSHLFGNLLSFFQQTVRGSQSHLILREACAPTI